MLINFIFKLLFILSIFKVNFKIILKTKDPTIPETINVKIKNPFYWSVKSVTNKLYKLAKNELINPIGNEQKISAIKIYLFVNK